MRHAHPPRVRGGLPARLVSLVFGLFICALGIVLILQADLGLSPWDVFHQGIADSTPLSFGAANIVVGVIVLIVAWRFGARVGLGTVANATLIGAFIEVLLVTDTIPNLDDSPLGAQTAFMLAGIACFGIGSAFYIGADMGAGPRDSLMLVVSVRLHTRVSLARGGIELAALAAGWALGGDVGVGTLAFALLIGPAVEAAFYLLDRSPLAVPRIEPSRAG